MDLPDNELTPIPINDKTGGSLGGDPGYVTGGLGEHDVAKGSGGDGLSDWNKARAFLAKVFGWILLAAGSVGIVVFVHYLSSVAEPIGAMKADIMNLKGANNTLSSKIDSLGESVESLKLNNVKMSSTMERFADTLKEISAKLSKR